MRTRHAISGRRDACRLVACGIAALALGLLLSATLLLPVSGCRGHDALAEHAAKWDRTVNLPLAPHGEELTNASLPPKSLFVDISMRDEAGAVRPKTAGKTVAIRCAINSPHKALVDVLDTLGKYKFRRVYVITM